MRIAADAARIETQQKMHHDGIAGDDDGGNGVWLKLCFSAQGRHKLVQGVEDRLAEFCETARFLGMHHAGGHVGAKLALSIVSHAGGEYFAGPKLDQFCNDRGGSQVNCQAESGGRLVSGIHTYQPPGFAGIRQGGCYLPLASSQRRYEVAQTGQGGLQRTAIQKRKQGFLEAFSIAGCIAERGGANSRVKILE